MKTDEFVREMQNALREQLVAYELDRLEGVSNLGDCMTCGHHAMHRVCGGEAKRGGLRILAEFAERLDADIWANGVRCTHTNWLVVVQSPAVQS